MGQLRGRRLLNAVVDGRATFAIAGAALGIGVYGFIATFKPYHSNRVLQPFGLQNLVAVAPAEPAFEPPSAVLPAGGMVAAVIAPQAPGETVVGVARPRAAVPLAAPAPPQVQAAGTEGGAEPLPAPTEPEPPKGIGPIIIDPEAVLVYFPPSHEESRQDARESGR